MNKKEDQTIMEEWISLRTQKTLNTGEKATILRTSSFVSPATIILPASSNAMDTSPFLNSNKLGSVLL